MKRPPLVTGFFVLVLLFLIGSGLVGGDPDHDETGNQAGERYPQDVHAALYQEHLARMEAESGDCR